MLLAMFFSSILYQNYLLAYMLLPKLRKMSHSHIFFLKIIARMSKLPLFFNSAQGGSLCIVTQSGQDSPPLYLALDSYTVTISVTVLQKHCMDW